MKKSFIALGLMFLASGVMKTSAAQPQEELDAMNYAEMVHSVDLGNQSSVIQQYQEKEARSNLIPKFGSAEQKKKGYRVETYRNQEVLLVTIPASELFAPNETTLMSKAGEILSPFKKYVDNTDKYRVLLFMHTDNTGSEDYRDMLTEDRVDAVFDWFEDQNLDTSFLFPYALGDELPLVTNDSQENRNKNRRLEIYIVPGETMLELAKKGKL